MRSKKNLTLFVCFALITGIRAQDIGVVHIGDPVPEVAMNNMRNYANAHAKLSDFKGKLVILNFWNRYCTSCIQHFPEMEKFQDEFKDKIQVILVTDNSEALLKRLFEVSPTMKSNKLPIITGDSIFVNMFPHVGVPYHVWIGGDQKLKYATPGWNTTESSIADYLAGKEVKIIGSGVENDEEISSYSFLNQLNYIKQDSSNTSAITGKEDYSLFPYMYSMVVKETSRFDGRSGRIFDFISPKTDNYYETDYFYKTGRDDWHAPFYRLQNFTIPQLYLDNSGFEHMRTFIETRSRENMDKYFWPVEKEKKGAWIAQNEYSYEVKFSDNPYFDTISNREKFVRKDLDRIFNLESKFEKRKLNCYVLKVIGDTSSLSSKSSDEIYEKTKEGGFIIRKHRIGAFTDVIRFIYGDIGGRNEITVIDETGIKGDIDINIDSFPDIASLNKQLAHYGLTIKEEMREVECLILKEL